jgi:hypothetical protein
MLIKDEQAGLGQRCRLARLSTIPASTPKPTIPRADKRIDGNARFMKHPFFTSYDVFALAKSRP